MLANKALDTCSWKKHWAEHNTKEFGKGQFVYRALLSSISVLSSKTVEQERKEASAPFVALCSALSNAKVD